MWYNHFVVSLKWALWVGLCNCPGCIYMYMCCCMFICMYVCMYLCIMYVRKPHKARQLFSLLPSPSLRGSWMLAETHRHTDVQLHRQTHTHRHTHTHTNTQTHTHTDIHTQTGMRCEANQCSCIDVWMHHGKANLGGIRHCVSRKLLPCRHHASQNQLEAWRELKGMSS